MNSPTTFLMALVQLGDVLKSCLDGESLGFDEGSGPSPEKCSHDTQFSKFYLTGGFPQFSMDPLPILHLVIFFFSHLLSITSMPGRICWVMGSPHGKSALKMLKFRSRMGAGRG